MWLLNPYVLLETMFFVDEHNHHNVNDIFVIGSNVTQNMSIIQFIRLGWR